MEGDSSPPREVILEQAPDSLDMKCGKKGPTVWVEHRGLEFHDGRLVGVFLRELNFQLEGACIAHPCQASLKALFSAIRQHSFLRLLAPLTQHRCLDENEKYLAKHSKDPAQLPPLLGIFQVYKKCSSG
jgi:hypothetical protein